MDPNQREEIVDRINSALSAFRKERDDIYRQKELALERLRLVKEERAAIETTVESMQEQLDQLISASREGIGRENDDISNLEREVDRLLREVRDFSVKR